MADPTKREDHKRFEFGKRPDGEPRLWDIGKFDPQTGSYIAYKLMNDLSPVLGTALAAAGGDLRSVAGNPEVMLGAALTKGLPAMSRADFADMQRDCLRVCRELLDGGPAPVLNDNGTYGVQNLDAQTVMALMIQTLVFNMSGFFDGGFLGTLGAMLGMSPPSSQP